MLTLEVGEQPIPGHTLTGRLGAGAFAEVWEAVRCDGTKVALKFLDTHARGGSQVGAEVRVLRALSELRHPNVVRLYAVVAASKYLVLVMERARCNLADLRAAYQAATGGHVPPEHALDLIDQAAEALDFLTTLDLAGASRGLQHCDVKPSNLLLSGETLKVADFGLCAGAGWRTHRNAWKGTRPYAAPELFAGSAVVGTDQFALAVTFCELVMGDRPFLRDEPAGPAAGLPIDMTRLRDSELPVIARALHPYPSARWPSCKAFAQALRKAIKQPRPSQSVHIFPRGRVGPLREAMA